MMYNFGINNEEGREGVEEEPEKEEEGRETGQEGKRG